MLLKYLTEVINIRKAAFDRDFFHFVHPAVQHAFSLIEPDQRKILPERLPGFLLEELPGSTAG